MITDPPLLVVRKSFPRVPADKLASLKRSQSGHLVDAMDGRGALDAAIKPVDPARASFAGTALTVETGPSDNLAILGALSVARPGDVIVSASDGFRATAVVGDIVAMLARNNGLAALVIDGMARDSEGIAGVGVPVFCRGITPNSCVKTGPGRIGLPIVAGGVAIRAGDAVCGDRDGVVVIPADELDRVLERLEAVLAAEAETIAKVAKGVKQFDRIAEIMASGKVRYVD